MEPHPTYEQNSFLDGTKYWVDPIEDQQMISYELTYRPSRGFNDTSWGLYVLGNSRRWGWFPTSSTTTSERVVGVSRCSFRFNEGNVSLHEEEISSNDACAGGVYREETSMIIRSGYKINLENNLMNFANLIESNWFIKVLVDGSGDPRSFPTEIQLSPGSQEILGLKVSLDPASNDVTVMFNKHTTLSDFDSRSIKYLGKCQIIYRGKTNFGKTFEVVTPELYGTYGVCKNGWMFELGWEQEILKGFLAVEELRELGYFKEPVIPDSPWPRELFKDWENTQYVSIGELYKFYGNFEGEIQVALEAFLKYSMGEELNYKEWELLHRLKEAVSELPDLKVYESNKKVVDNQFDAYFPILPLGIPHDFRKK